MPSFTTNTGRNYKNKLNQRCTRWASLFLIFQIMCVQSSHHGWYGTIVKLTSLALVLFELSSVSGFDRAWIYWEEVRVVGVGLGLEGPLGAGLLPKGVKPGEGGEGEGLAVALVF